MFEEYNSLNLKKNMVKYLDKTDELSKIEELAKKYHTEFQEQIIQENCIPPLKITIDLDFALLGEFAGEFASLLTNEPHIAREILTDLIQTCCIVLTDLEELSVYLLIKLTSFPELSNSSRYVDDFKNHGLFTKHGILCELKPEEKYTLTILYKCEYDRCYAPEKVYNEAGNCSACGKKLVEVPRSRVTGDKVNGLFLDPQFLHPSGSAKRAKGVLIEFRDELAAGLNIGMRYNIAVTFQDNQYLAWGIVQILPEPLMRSLNIAAMPDLPDSFTNLLSSLREETHGSPWSLVTGVAAHLAEDLFPLSAFLHLKTALLLSLASICSKCPVPVLALGDCGSLMTNALKCSPRAILAPNESTSLLLATHGVCFLQENANLSFITTAIESELVTIKTEKSKRGNECFTYPLRSAVWVCWQCNKHSGQDVHRLHTLIEIFGIPFLEEINVNDEDISNHLLNKAINPSFNEKPSISKEDFRKFIDIVSCLNVNMSPMASALIRNYFVASRMERPQCLPLKSIKVLTGLSEAHARLSLRDTVTFEDAVASIFLYEESIGLLFGPSMFSKQPSRDVVTNDPVTIARQMDNVLARFSLWLSSYTKCQLSTDATQTSQSVHSE